MPVTAGGVTGGARQTATTQPVVPRRQLSPTATNTSNTANARVNWALAIRQSMGGVQGSRATAETGVNADLAESLRLNLIEQERLRKNAQGPGSVNPVQFRAMQSEMATNQNAVNAGVNAINAIRTAQTQRAGQLTAADTTLQDRAMSEAGAFDRAALNLDVADIQGQYGLAKQGLANQGAVAAQQAIDPLEQFALNSMRATREQFAGNATPEEQARLAIGQENAALGLQAIADPTAGAAPVEIEIMGKMGPETIQVTPETALRIGEYRAMVANPGAYGLSQADIEANAEALISGTTTPEQIAAEKAARQQRNSGPARPSRVTTDPPQRGGL